MATVKVMKLVTMHSKTRGMAMETQMEKAMAQEPARGWEM
jgi:hypothetical protein